MLVDGGKSERQLPDLFKIHTGTSGVDILVCTHNDADHANGILGFLKSSLRCQEIWLPGSWISIPAQVFMTWSALIVELIKDINSIDDESLKRIEDATELESYARVIENETASMGPPREEVDLVNGWPPDWVEGLESRENISENSFLNPGVPWIIASFFYKNNDLKVALLLSAINAAKRIRQIAEEAYHRNLKIRWFEFDLKTPEGGDPKLLPLNSREVAWAGRSSGITLLKFIALTVSNRQSLVFCAPGNKEDDGVLFTADSDLSNIKICGKLRISLCTVPHHGSEANRYAYGNCSIDFNLKNLTWVRSDGRFSKRPGASFLIKAAIRYCTMCRTGQGAFTDKRVVSLSYRNSLWNPSPASRCECV